VKVFISDVIHTTNVSEISALLFLEHRMLPKQSRKTSAVFSSADIWSYQWFIKVHSTQLQPQTKPLYHNKLGLSEYSTYTWKKLTD